MSEHHTFFLVYEIVALSSAVACIPVVLSYFLFKDIRNKLHFRLACTISFCYMIANFAAAIGEPANGTFLCGFQGIVQNYFNTAGVLWTTGIAYMLYLLVTTGTVNVTYGKLGYFCWGVPLVAVFLPYVSAYYGRLPGSTYGWCYLRLRPGVPQWHLVLWMWFSFYVWLFLSLLTMTAWAAIIYHRVVIVKSNLAPVVRMARRKLRLYPVALVVCYFPIAGARIVSALFPPDTPWIMYVIYICNLSLGLLVAIIFFATNDIVRRLWWNLMFGSGTNSTTTGAIRNGSNNVNRFSMAADFFGRKTRTSASASLSATRSMEMGAAAVAAAGAGTGGGIETGIAAAADININNINYINRDTVSSRGSESTVIVPLQGIAGDNNNRGTGVGLERPSCYGADADGDLVEVLAAYNDHDLDRHHNANGGNGDDPNRDSCQSEDGFGYSGDYGRNRRDTEIIEAGGDYGETYRDVQNPLYR